MVQWASAATSALSLWCTDLGEGLLPELVEWMGWSDTDTDSEAQTDRKMISTPPSGELYGLSKMNLKPTRKPWGPSPTLRVEEQTLEGQMESEINNVGEWRSDANVIQARVLSRLTKPPCPKPKPKNSIVQPGAEGEVHEGHFSQAHLRGRPEDPRGAGPGVSGEP